MKTKITLLIVGMWLVIGCSNKEKRVSKDPFYAFTGGWGEMNIPLIKPFHLFCYDGKNWRVDADGGYNGYKRDRGGCSIGGVQRFQGSETSHFSWELILAGIIAGIAKQQQNDSSDQDRDAGMHAGIMDGNSDRKDGKINRLNPYASFKKNKPLIILKSKSFQK